MIGVTIGTGAKWNEIAKFSAAIMEKNTGIPCVVLSDRDYDPYAHYLKHSSWLKTKVFDIFTSDDILVFDADVFCVNKWDPTALYDQQFCCVRDCNWESPWVTDPCRLANIDPSRYFNAGLFMLNRHTHKKVLDQTYTYAKHGVDYIRYLEQTAMNKVVQELNVGVTYLESRYNMLANSLPANEQDLLKLIESGEVTNLHLAGTNPDFRIAMYERIKARYI